MCHAKLLLLSILYLRSTKAVRTFNDFLLYFEENELFVSEVYVLSDIRTEEEKKRYLYVYRRTIILMMADMCRGNFVDRTRSLFA